MNDGRSRPAEREYRHFIYDSLRWECFEHRPGDIYVCTPPKCGTTWMQMIVASLLYPSGDRPGPVMEISPWIDARFVPLEPMLAGLHAQQHRRSVKTHTPADGIPWYPTGSYIVVGRDGRDAFMSFLNHLRNMRPDVVGELIGSALAEGIELEPPPSLDDVHTFFAEWLEEGSLFQHIASFWARRGEPNACFVHYDDMKRNLEGEMRRVATFLDIEIDEALWPGLVEQCRFASMRASGDDIGPFDEHFVGGSDTFFHKGTTGQWRDVLTPEELDAYDHRATELMPPDAVRWLAGDTAASAV